MRASYAAPLSTSAVVSLATTNRRNSQCARHRLHGLHAEHPSNAPAGAGGGRVWASTTARGRTQEAPSAGRTYLAAARRKHQWSH
eukprot:scaffold220235_cov28-Tisochrysis_lutea.AAC.4